jgi:hypothetical protein
MHEAGRVIGGDHWPGRPAESRTAAVRFLTRAVCALLLLVPLGACGKKIGDACKVALDCNTDDDTRFCDISQPGGYCSIDGCDEVSCPEESVCIRFFPARFATTPCDPAAPTACTPSEVCLPEGKCVPRATERRYCALKCGGSGDCRENYECRESGMLGSVALTRKPGQVAKFCAPALR